MAMSATGKLEHNSTGKNLRVLTLSHCYPRSKNDYYGNFIHRLVETLDRQCRVYFIGPEMHDRREEISGLNRHYFFGYLPSSLKISLMGNLVTNDLRANPLALLVMPLFLLIAIVYGAVKTRKIAPDVIHSHWCLPMGFVGAMISRFYGIPLMISFPGSDVMMMQNNWLARKLSLWAIARAGRITTNSHDIQNTLVAYGVPRSKIELVIYGVDTDLFHRDTKLGSSLRKELNISVKAKVLLCVGRFVPKKGFIYMLMALSQIRESFPLVRLIMVGGGPEESAYRSLARERGLESHIIWAGIVPTSRLMSFYNACDIFIMPSVREPVDGLNVAVVEAMACGKAVVATEVGGNELAIQHGQNGFLVPEKDEVSLSEKVEFLLRNERINKKFGEASRRLAAENLHWQAIAAQYTDLYAKMKLHA
jgi:glycosyltransferase involved in cell wall biosynthesis